MNLCGFLPTLNHNRAYIHYNRTHNMTQYDTIWLNVLFIFARLAEIDSEEATLTL